MARFHWCILASALCLIACEQREPSEDPGQSEDVTPPEEGPTVPWGSERWAPGSSEPGDQMPPASASDFGRECFKPDGCNGDSPDWPDCSNEQCSTGDCAFPVFTSDYGYCTRSCTQDYQCENGSGPYGSDYRCLTDGTNGICAPGSNARCDYGVAGQCDDPDEVCKFALIYAPDSFYGAVCQPRTPEGAEVFGACNESEGQFCANDMCISGICTTFCDPEAETEICPTGFRCFDDWYLFGQDSSYNIDVCLPEYCELDSECPEGFGCDLRYEYNSENILRGSCTPIGEGEVTNGGECCVSQSCTAQNERVGCVGGTCYDDEDGTGFCAGLCNSNDDCPDNSYCGITNFTISSEPGRAPAQLCRPATGSGRPCSLNADCAADEAADIPEEACEYVVTGNITAGRLNEGEQINVSGRCASIPLGAVEFGSSCNEANPCRTDSLCLRSGSTFCSETCRSTEDCQPDALCFGMGMVDDIEAGVCVPKDKFGLDDSSLNACSRNVDCGDEQHCSINVISSRPPVVELLCKQNEGEVIGAGDCTADEDCRSGTCMPRSTDISVPGFCLSVCRTADECGDGFSCERQVVDPPSGAQAKVCRPASECLPCNLDETAVCGGDFLCSQIRYDRRGLATTCLRPCGGLLDEETCGETASCLARLDGEGVEVEGDFVCVPQEPNTTCSASMPR